MVQITNALLVATVIVPVLSAPLEAREPKFNFRKAGGIAGKVISGAGAAATVGSLFMPQPQPQPAHQRRSVDEFEDVEAREPKFSSAGLKTFAKVGGKVVSGAGAAATVGSLFMPQQHQRRDLEDLEDLEAREPRLSAGQIKSFAKGAVEVGKYAKSGVEFGATVAPLFPHKQRRSFDEIEERAFRMPSHSTMRGIAGAVAGAAGVAGTVAVLNTRPQPVHAREVEVVLDARDPLLSELYFRDNAEEIEAREPNFFKNLFKGIGKGIGKVAKLVIREDENGELYVRDLSDEHFLD